MAITQDSRLLNLSTPLGKDKLLLTAFAGQEGMSRLFSYQLDLISEDLAIKPDDIVGENVTFAIYRDGETLRYFNGMVKAFIAGDQDFQRQETTSFVPRRSRALVVVHDPDFGLPHFPKEDGATNHRADLSGFAVHETTS